MCAKARGQINAGIALDRPAQRPLDEWRGETLQPATDDAGQRRHDFRGVMPARFRIVRATFSGDCPWNGLSRGEP